ncbi:hypothetical protein PVT68_18160 [Microbulbifer bruguierae]|uniref:Uncharacterized protein n=1 Tax=Microbulbifer bruguierae TaxID=3029061 RepID=A0ABY8NDI0_9GAMM|nr:hypothetical protein [Microbulbifer bruguierae]WGL16662.1 hypothetical protein PVT68_18160 [Microbulbifer bruguierae]
MNVFKRLEELSNDGSFYLKALNLSFQPSEVESDLSIFSALASELESEHAAYGNLLLDVNWRSHLIAYMCLTVSENKSHLEDLKSCFKNGSMVSPQIAVAMARLHFREMMDFFPNYINGGHGAESSSQIGASLILLQSMFVRELTFPKSQLNIERFYLGQSVAQYHSGFWLKHRGSARVQP